MSNKNHGNHIYDKLFYILNKSEYIIYPSTNNFVKVFRRHASDETYILSENIEDYKFFEELMDEF